MDISLALSGVAVGTGFGFVLQRGGFCLNTAFRNIIYIKDFTIFRAYILALIIIMVGANLLQYFGLLHAERNRQEFVWLANMLGGYLFGVGMVLAGGCGSGTWYRVGEGLVGSWIAALGFMAGASAARNGVLSGMYDYLRGLVISPGSTVTVYEAVGMNKWLFIVIAAIIGLIFVFAVRPQHYNSAQAGYHWRITGILIGLLAMLGLYVSELMTGRPSGIVFPGPSDKLLMTVAAGSRPDWGVYMLFGVPLGSFISAKGNHEFSLRAPRANVMAQQLSGGLIMGAGGMLSGGCAVGHGLTGLSLLTMASLVSMIFLILGSWTMVYFLFMKGASKK